MNHWVSCSKFTVKVKTDPHGTIVQAAPMVRKFLGQPIASLLKWASKLGGFQHCKWED